MIYTSITINCHFSLTRPLSTNYGQIIYRNILVTFYYNQSSDGSVLQSGQQNCTSKILKFSSLSSGERMVKIS